MREIVLVKLGGSLITDKRRPRSLRPMVLARLAREIRDVAAAHPGGLVVGHGSGSFGHVPAREFGLHEGLSDPAQRPGIAATQAEAAALHHQVLDALRRCGAEPFSLAPSAAVVAAAGRPVAIRTEPLELALELGLVPVVFGDVAMDRERGVAILSTEAVFEALVEAFDDLEAAGAEGSRALAVRRAFWLGETEGVYDAAGRTVPRVTEDNAAAVLEAADGAAGTDVTGGMRHRLETALRLAGRGVASWILDGREPGILARALAGDPVPGTVVPAVVEGPG